MKSGNKQSDEICDAKTREPLVTIMLFGWHVVHGLWLIRGKTANRERWPQPPPLNFSKIDNTKEDVSFTQSKI